MDRPGQRVTASLQLNHPNDNAEHAGVGVEYAFREMVYLRGGFRLNADAESFALGGGVAVPISAGIVRLDYAYSDMDYLGSVNRISLEMRF
jgi:hypothetical protein